MKHIIPTIIAVLVCMMFAAPAQAIVAHVTPHVAPHAYTPHVTPHESTGHASGHASDTTVTHGGKSYSIHENEDGTGTITHSPTRTIIPFHTVNGTRECDKDKDGKYAADECPAGTGTEKTDAPAWVGILILTLIALPFLAIMFLD